MWKTNHPLLQFCVAMFVRADSSLHPLQLRLTPDGLFTFFLDSWSVLVVSSGLSSVDPHVFQKTSPYTGHSPAAVQAVWAHWSWTEWKDFSHILCFCLYYYNFYWFCKYFLFLSSWFTMVLWCFHEEPVFCQLVSILCLFHEAFPRIVPSFCVTLSEHLRQLSG